MPRRNLAIILIAAILSIACYGRAQRNRFASLFAEAVHRISSSYVREVDERQLFEDAMQGMLGQLDPYSTYIGPEQYLEFKSDIDQEFGGIGIIVSPNPKTKHLLVLSPIVGTPAHQAGLLAGDTIVKVDDMDIDNFTMAETVKHLRGKPGTDVRLSVLHRGDDEAIEVTITRAVIKVPSVLGDTIRQDGSWNFVLESQSNVGYIRLTTFGERTIEELESAIQSLDTDHLVGLILDLRSNAGGLLEAATATCDMFINQGEIVTLRGRSALVRDRRVASQGTTVDTDLPLAVLINKYSASASEIVAACLQDHNRAVIVGERSYGKGTVQNVIPLELGKSVMKLTTATFWRPSNKNIHRAKDADDDGDWGVTPNEGYLVALSEEEFRQLILARNKADYQGFEFQADDHSKTTLDNQVEKDPDIKAKASEKAPNSDKETSHVDPETSNVKTQDEPSENNLGTESGPPATNTEHAENQTNDKAVKTIDDPQLRRAVEYILETSQNKSAPADAA